MMDAMPLHTGTGKKVSAEGDKREKGSGGGAGWLSSSWAATDEPNGPRQPHSLLVLLLLKLKKWLTIKYLNDSKTHIK